MLTAILRSLRTGVVTLRYPERPARIPERFRGAPRVRPGSPMALLPAASSCPSGAITATATRHAIDLGRCVFCGRCADALPGDPVDLGREIELASRSRENLVVEVESGPGEIAVPVAAPPRTVEVADRIRKILGRSLHLRHLDAGSCNACDWELTALLNPVHDVRRLGIDFVASPRHADGVVVTGPVTRNLEQAVRRTWEAVPEPRIAVAVGACAVSGGIAGKGYASAGGAGEVLPIDVYVPGCPPRPEAIVFGLLLAVGRVEERRRVVGHLR